ncbi:MAG: hypothetical protein AAB855_04285 [Patescibacteria group bacterium]
MADIRTPRAKFIIGFLFGFIIGLFAYTQFVDFNSPVALYLWYPTAIGIGIIGGLLMQYDKSGRIDPDKSHGLLSPDADSGKSFRLTKTNISPEALATTSVTFGIFSGFFFDEVFTPIALASGIVALIYELRGKKRIGVFASAGIGVVASTAGIAWRLLNVGV